MAIGDTMRAMFGKPMPQVPAPVPQGGNLASGNTQQGPTGKGESNQLEPNNPGRNDGTGGKLPADPLDKFSDVWQPPTGADGKPIPRAQKEPMFPADPAKYFEFAQKQDFRKFVKPETITAVMKGGDEAAAALLQIVQDIGSSTFASSSVAASKMIERATSQQRSDFEASLPQLFKKMNLKENLGNKNPVFSHPAAQPIVEALQATLAQRYPDASASELQSTAEEFLTTFASQISGKKEDATEGNKGGKKEEADWSKFLDPTA